MVNPLIRIPEPHHSFNHAAAKAKWASVLLDHLNLEVTAFIENTQFPVSLQYSSETAMSSIYIETPQRMAP